MVTLYRSPDAENAMITAMLTVYEYSELLTATLLAWRHQIAIPITGSLYVMQGWLRKIIVKASQTLYPNGSGTAEGS
jgi:hypothetical protein